MGGRMLASYHAEKLGVSRQDADMGGIRDT